MSLVLTLLKTERPLTAEELWEQVTGYTRIENQVAFRQAFERDKKVLRAQGLPLVVQTVYPDGVAVDGYRIDRKKYYLNIAPMEADELAALRLATSMFRIGDGEAGDWIGQRDERVSADGDGAGMGPLANVEAVDGLNELFSSVADRATVQFTYSGKDRTLDPLRLDLSGGRWYVTGHDHGHDEIRIYRVDKIEGPVAVGRPGSFVRDPDVVVDGPVPPWQFEVDETVTARILVDAGHADWAIAQTVGQAEIERNDDGSVVLTMEASNHDGLRWFVLELLDHGELLEPKNLRDDLVTWLEALT
jgi:predicted DNA-binding transcriptional regulator YafY